MTTLGLIVGDFEGLLCRSLPVLGRPWMKQAICWLSEDAPTFEMNTQETTAESLFACPCKGRCYPAAFNPDVRFWQRISRLTQSVQLTHAFNIRQGSLSVCLYPTRESRVKVSLTRLILGWCSENPTLGCHCLEQPVLDQRSWFDLNQSIVYNFLPSDANGSGKIVGVSLPRALWLYQRNSRRNLIYCSLVGKGRERNTETNTMGSRCRFIMPFHPYSSRGYVETRMNDLFDQIKGCICWRHSPPAFSSRHPLSSIRRAR